MIDLSGQVYGKLTVKSLEKDSKAVWLCLCDCGNEVLVQSYKLRNGNKKSCGCLRNMDTPFIGLSYLRKGADAKEFAVWKSMLIRALDNNYKYYENVGVNPEWTEPAGKGFIKFLEDMGKIPEEGFELDRIDVYGDYCKENCRWVDKYVQAQNKRKQGNNTSGRTGVFFRKDTNQWRACIYVRGKTIYLGSYDDYDQAVAAREVAELEYYGFNKL